IVAKIEQDVEFLPRFRPKVEWRAGPLLSDLGRAIALLPTLTPGRLQFACAATLGVPFTHVGPATPRLRRPSLPRLLRPGWDPSPPPGGPVGRPSRLSAAFSLSLFNESFGHLVGFSCRRLCVSRCQLMAHCGNKYLQRNVVDCLGPSRRR